jgi:hypothetical protein
MVASNGSVRTSPRFGIHPKHFPGTLHLPPESKEPVHLVSNPSQCPTSKLDKYSKRSEYISYLRGQKYGTY